VRTFIAIELPQPVQDSLAALIERLRGSRARVTWVKPENMHLTLRFLGNMEPDPLDRLRANLEVALHDTRSFALRVQGLGAFPNARRPSVLWAGVESDDGELGRVHAIAERAAQSIGLAPETKAFHPHLTLARVKNPAEAAAVMPFWEREQGFEGGSFPVNRVILFSSTLTPRGPVHRPIQEFPFQ
jgi:2'-5' RNA ligase